MPPKRAPLVNTATKPRPSYGTPYQIYSEVANVGKNLEGTKKRVKWRFGWSDVDKEFEVEFVHSIVTGKKTIFEDGKEIVSSSNLLNSDFAHSWNSENSLHIFRVEASLGMTTENTYMFLIDGQRFIDMPRKPIVGRKTNESSNYETKSPSVQASRRASTGTVPDSHEPPRAHFQSPKILESKTFDPFAASGDDMFQPTSPKTPSSTSQHLPKKPISAAATQPKPVVQVANLLDDFDTPSSSVAPASSVKSASASQFFDDFDTPKQASATPKPTSNGFSEFPTNFNSSFGSAPPSNTNANTKPSTSSNSFSAFSNDVFASTPTSASSNTTSFVTTGSKSPAVSSTAGFATFPTTSFDPFSNQSTNAANNNGRPARRASAQEISQDFVGLTVTSPSHANEPPPPPVAVESVQVEAATSPKPGDSANPDLWGTNLVNLDLTGKERPKQVDKPIRSSVTTLASNTPIMKTPPAPSLNSAMGMPTTSNPNPAMNPNAGPAFNTMPPQPQPMGRPSFTGTMNSNPSMSSTPINPFASGVSFTSSTSSSNTASSNITRGGLTGAPLDPFQTLPALANPGFQTASTQPKTYEQVAPLSAMVGNKSSSFAPSGTSAMTNNAMKSAPLSNAQRSNAPPVPGTSLDSLNWKN